MTKRPYRRRKQVPCVLCGELDYDVDAVCHPCREDYDYGKVSREILETGGEKDLVPFRFGDWWRWYAFDAAATDIATRDSELESELRGLLMGLVNTQKLKNRYRKSQGKFVVGEAYDENGLTKGFDGLSAEIYLVNAEVANQIQRIIEIVRALRQIDKNEAKENAERFLLQMARDEILIEKVSAVYPMKKD